MQRLWFSNSIEGLFSRGLGARLTPELRSRIRDAGINLERLEPGYPPETLIAACRSVIPALYPEADEAEAFYQLGCSFMLGYSQTLLGGAMVQMMKLVGPRRTLERMTKNFRTGGNYIETRFILLGPGSVELWVSDVTGIPDFYRGILDEGGRMIRAAEMQTTMLATEAPAALFRVDWKE